jgi:hypothetical protein
MNTILMTPKQVKLNLIILNLICFSVCHSQIFTLVKATSQHWSGGVVGHYGTNYEIVLETQSKSAIPDTVWINGAVYPIHISKQNNNCKCTIDTATGKITYDISIGEIHNHLNQKNNADTKDTLSPGPNSIRHFDGEAMISYKRKHKQRFYIIQSFDKLRPKNYL